MRQRLLDAEFRHGWECEREEGPGMSARDDMNRRSVSALCRTRTSGVCALVLPLGLVELCNSRCLDVARFAKPSGKAGPVSNSVRKRVPAVPILVVVKLLILPQSDFSPSYFIHSCGRADSRRQDE